MGMRQRTSLEGIECVSDFIDLTTENSLMN